MAVRHGKVTCRDEPVVRGRVAAREPVWGRDVRAGPAVWIVTDPDGTFYGGVSFVAGLRFTRRSRRCKRVAAQLTRSTAPAGCRMGRTRPGRRARRVR